ncbi:non-ribosomal peptide synthetase [Pleurocapsa sp. FMAR1]|uniref:non-ribosomal peptide synthetase n=1 Tax=Pleurocapsa sp. FMAR1 TaxID=3040204 RepID=UPI0029C6D1B0|nr:amino acid adenylation domain-containing protein [Pleurocapsa sp. FMAR1]
MNSKNTEKNLYAASVSTDIYGNTDNHSEKNQSISQSDSFETSDLPILNSIQSRLDFLERLFQGKLPVLELPTTKSRAQVKKFVASNQTLVLSQELSESLKNIAIQEDVSLFSVLLTAFQILLNRYTRQTEIIVGTPVNKQKRIRANTRFGVLENIILLPLQLNSESCFNELIQTLQITLDAQIQQNLTISKELVEILMQNAESTALFKVLFELENISEETLADSDWEILNLDLSWKIIEQPEGLSCVFTYNGNLFEDAAIARMMGHFQVLLESVVAQPKEQIVTLPLLTPAEKQQILVTWNDTQIDYPNTLCIHQLFEQQVAKTPDAIALIFEEQHLTYQELNQRANSLAHYLRDIGVKSEVLVGICVERSVEMVVGILAILKAAGAYVPLDPSYPVDRIGYMLEDAQVAVLLTQKHLNLDFAQQKVVNLEEFDTAIAPESSHNLTNTVAPNNLAYVIYTSGSTGKPKGVQIEHRTAVNLLTSIAREPGINASDTLLSVTTISFDIAVAEIFLPLIVGAKLAVVSRQTATDGHQLLQALEKYQVTFMQPTPVSWKILLAAGWQGSKNLKMISTGEALSKELAKQLQDKGASLWNLYGPTETTIWSSVHQVKADAEPISIGHPLANVKYYILDSHLMLLPVGIPGELYIGGDCLARGYLNRPELTIDRFIRDPFSDRPEARMYKTGDLAYYAEDGTVICVGRLDRQVKIRGFRIEIEEIESAILQYPGVQAAAVTVQENSATGYQRLIGYIVNQPNATVNHEALRGFLKQQLPAHMIPFGFMTIDALPLTLNGKIDPKALPPFDFTSQTVAESYVAPRSQLETQLASAWEKVLEVKRVGIKDDFLELGGSSLLAITLVSEIEQALGQKIPLKALANLTTIEQMARCFAEGQPTIEDLDTTPDGIEPEDYQALLTIMAGRQGDRPRPNSLMIALQKQGSKPPLFFCANAYEEAAPLADYLRDEQPFYLMESGYFTLECNSRQIKALASHHLKDILTVQPQPPYILAGYSTGGLIALEIAQQLQAMDKEVALLAILDTAGSHPLYQNYQQLNYTLRTNWNRLASLKLADKISYLQARIKLGITAKLPTTEKSTSDPYIIQPYQGKVSLFLATEKDRTFFFDHRIKHWLCPRNGWHQGIVSQLKIEQVPGNHFNMLEEPYVRVLAEKLQQAL